MSKKGQGMTEYVLIIALIALVSVVAIQTFGDEIKAKFEELTEVL